MMHFVGETKQEIFVLLGLITAAAAIVIDQLSKYWVLNHVVNDSAAIVLAPFFNVVRAWNTGVSFSMFNDGGVTGIVGLTVVALVIVAFLLNWLRKENCRLVQIALGMIIGGAIGNVIDRVRLGAVFDFLDFHLGGSHWPAFNAADSFICIGAMMIIIHGLWFNEKSTEEKA